MNYFSIKENRLKYFLYFLCFFVFSYVILTQDDLIITADSGDYILLANQIKNLDFSHYNAIRTHGYPLLILLTRNNLILLIVQIIFHLFNVIIIYKILTEITGNFKFSFFFSIIYLFYSYGINNTRLIMAEALTTTLITCSIYYFYNYINYKKLKHIFISEFFSSLASITKPLFIFLPIILTIFTYILEFFEIIKILFY